MQDTSEVLKAIIYLAILLILIAIIWWVWQNFGFLDAIKTTIGRLFGFPV